MTRNWIGLVVLFSVVNFSLAETQQKCSSYGKMMCNDGECINVNLFCDGTKNCKDGSDEYASICSQLYESKDRITNTTKIKRAIVAENGCMVSKNIDFLIVTSADSKQILPSGTIVDKNTIVQYSCGPRQLLDGVTTNICINSKWVYPEPICISYCSDLLLKGVTFTATCEYNHNPISCEGHLKPGTIAKIACQLGYKIPADINVQDELRCDESGEWDYIPFRCEPICGIENSESSPLTIGGERLDFNAAPWHAAIYVARRNGYEHICQGTIINAKVIVSAAHCFWLEDLKTIVNHSIIIVGVGKVYRSFSAEEPFPVQFFKVSEIHVPNQYQGLLKDYEDDVAILVLADNIQFMSNVRPICFELRWRGYQQRSGIVGRLPSWGSRRNATEEALNVLRLVELATISYDDCRNALDPRFRNSLTGDKFCVVSSDEGIPCQGDSGGGFVVPKYINGVKTYFLEGVVSIALSDDEQCSKKYIALTNIRFHLTNITLYELAFRPK